jgi:hypothetical protein
MMRTSELGYDRLFIGGQWREPSTSAVIEVHSVQRERRFSRLRGALPIESRS